MNHAVIDGIACSNILSGHPWIFSNKIRKIDIHDDSPIIYVYSKDGGFLCTAYHNPLTSIAMRVLSRDKITVDENFFCRRIEQSLFRRYALGLQNYANAFRIVNGESDFLPGLIVDKYDNVAVIQTHTSGMEFYKRNIVDSLIRILSPKSIFEKSENASLLLEGGKKKKGIIFGNEISGDILIKENGLEFAVDIINGQKTGFFLDQRDNRLFIRKYAKGLRVLNLFSYTCSFGINALAGGADYVMNVDVSDPALEKGRLNQQLNGFAAGHIDYQIGNAFDFLENDRSGYDLIILDPPAFIKSFKDKPKGLKAYQRLNRLAMSRLESNGMLFSCSCSSYVSMSEFLKTLHQASSSLKKGMQLLGCFGHAPDHPVLASFPEGHYLKSVFLRII